MKKILGLTLFLLLFFVGCANITYDKTTDVINNSVVNPFIAECEVIVKFEQKEGILADTKEDLNVNLRNMRLTEYKCPKNLIKFYHKVKTNGQDIYLNYVNHYGYDSAWKEYGGIKGRAPKLNLFNPSNNLPGLQKTKFTIVLDEEYCYESKIDDLIGEKLIDYYNTFNHYADFYKPRCQLSTYLGKEIDNYDFEIPYNIVEWIPKFSKAFNARFQRSIKIRVMDKQSHNLLKHDINFDFIKHDFNTPESIFNLNKNQLINLPEPITINSGWRNELSFRDNEIYDNIIDYLKKSSNYTSHYISHNISEGYYFLTYYHDFEIRSTFPVILEVTAPGYKYQRIEFDMREEINKIDIYMVDIGSKLRIEIEDDDGNEPSFHIE